MNRYSMSLLCIGTMVTFPAFAMSVNSVEIAGPSRIQNRENTLAAIGAAPFGGQVPNATEDALESDAKESLENATKSRVERKTSVKTNQSNGKKNKATEKKAPIDTENDLDQNFRAGEQTDQESQSNSPSQDLMRGY